MSDSVGSVSVDVVPDARGWAEKLRAQIQDTLRLPVEPELPPDTDEKFKQKGKESSEKFAGEFDRILQTKVRAALAALPDVAIDADTSDAVVKMAELRTELETLSKQQVGVDVSNDDALAKIAEIQGALASLAAENPDIQVNVDSLAAATQLAAIGAQVDRLNGRTATVRVKVDRSGISRAFGAADSLVGKLGLLPGLLVAGTAAAVPLAATLGGVATALAVPLAIAGGGATLYGFLVGAAIKETEAQKKKLDTLAKAVDTAKTSLANAQASAQASAANSSASAKASAAASLTSAEQSAAATIRAARQAEATATTAAGRQAARQRIAAAQRTLEQRRAAIDTSLSTRQAAIASGSSASVEAAQRKVNEATKAYHDQLKSITPEQTKFLDAQSQLHSAFQDLIQRAGPALLGPATQFLHLLVDLLPSAQPILKAVAGSLSDMIGSLDKAGQSSGFQTFIRGVAHQLGPDLREFGHIIGNVTLGLGGLFLAIDKRAGSGGMLSAIDHLTRNFADWANSKAARHDVREFFDYFHRVGPQVADTLGSVGGALGHIVRALAPLGPPTLHVVSGIADALSGIPVPVLTALAATFVALTGVQKLGGFKALGFLTKGIGGTRGSTPANPLWVASVNGGGIGGVGGAGGKAGFFAKWTERLFPAALGGGALAGSDAAAMAALFGVGAVAQGVLTHHELTTAQRLAMSRSPGIFGHGSNQDETQWQINHGPHINYGKLMMEANGYFTSTTTHWDAMKAHAEAASRQIDLIGPNAAESFRAANQVLGLFVDKVATIRDKKFAIIAQDQDAIRSLERLQAMTIRDKHFKVIQNNIERTVGPGGGMQRHALGGLITGAGSGTSDSVASWLSNGEFVVNAAATARHRALLEQLNRGTYHHSAQIARHMAQVAAYAPAGFSGGGSGSGRAAGPTYTGPINITAQDHADFQRQMMQRNRQAALSNVQVGP